MNVRIFGQFSDFLGESSLDLLSLPIDLANVLITMLFISRFVRFSISGSSPEQDYRLKDHMNNHVNRCDEFHLQ